MSKKSDSKPLTSIQDEVVKRSKTRIAADSAPKEYPLAFTDKEFMLRDELRPVRLQLELLKPELVMQDHNIEATIIFFGSARIPCDIETAKDRLAEAEAELKANPKSLQAKKQVTISKNVLDNAQYMKQATKLARIISTEGKTNTGSNFYVLTGGGPGFMEAANRGAYDVNSRSVALNVILPHEQIPNKYVTPELTFQFHYFAIRKMHFFIRARAMVAFPGGFGTFDELFDALTLMQTEKMDRIPILLFNEKFWREVINFEALVEHGTISEEDLSLFQYVETAEQAWQIIKDFYGY